MILHRRLAFGRIARGAARRAEPLLDAWLSGLRRAEAGWTAVNPRPGGGTLHIGMNGDWHDPATGAEGRDLIDLAGFVHQLARPDAALLVARTLGTHPYD